MFFFIQAFSIDQLLQLSFAQIVAISTINKKSFKNNPLGLHVLWEYVGLERLKKIFTLGKDKIYFKTINIIIAFKHVLKYHTYWTLNHIWTCNDDANIL